ncbi:hypothetical protein SAMN04487992_101474 [Cellulophaga baltica]|uniref:Uncharacterized protein n=1 Tax=Cellulophaga baltica TaxID=76594 RepID=A0A1G7DBP8_9FLAO|nr:hypothetical protein SAMN04487992_101474 [Cellulophaga baltica]
MNTQKHGSVDLKRLGISIVVTILFFIIVVVCSYFAGLVLCR